MDKKFLSTLKIETRIIYNLMSSPFFFLKRNVDSSNIEHKLFYIDLEFPCLTNEMKQQV